MKKLNKKGLRTLEVVIDNVVYLDFELLVTVKPKK